MKKFICHSLMLACFLFTACHGEVVSTIQSGIKTISKSRNTNSLAHEKSADNAVNAEKVSSKEIEKINLTLLPAYAWDPKGLVW